jgi:hypothetical protein
MGLSNAFFPSGFPTKTLHSLLLSPIRATCHAHLILTDFITRTIMGEKYTSLSSSLYSFLRDKWVSVITAWRILRLRNEERPPIWRVAANILNKQLRTVDKGRSSSMGVGRGANNVWPYKRILLLNYLLHSRNILSLLDPYFPNILPSYTQTLVF